jgi:hypothetical protein
MPQPIEIDQIRELIDAGARMVEVLPPGEFEEEERGCLICGFLASSAGLDPRGLSKEEAMGAGFHIPCSSSDQGGHGRCQRSANVPWLGHLSLA